MKGNHAILLRAGIACALFLGQAACAQRLPLERIKLPPGFEISVFADNVPNARSLALGANQVVFVGTRASSVYAVRYRDAKTTQVITLASDLRMPNGVAVKDGALYVAEVNRILRFDHIETQLDARPKPAVVTDRYPRETHHGWKFIRFGPDGWLYVPVGAPCNICEPDPQRYALISRIRPDGSAYEVFASGIRNSVGFDWDPRTKQLWFTDNGRDWAGEDGPQDELNRVSKVGLNFGFPYCHAQGIVDPEIKKPNACDGVTMPVTLMGPHAAVLGMRFYSGSMFPDEYRNSILVARHGSWNRTQKTGYDVVRVTATPDGKNVLVTPFMTGFLDQAGNTFWGRPTDVMLMPDGSVLVSDEQMGAIYRVTYAK